MTLGTSIVIATRNRLDYLKEAVAAVLSQSFGDLQLIVVDDASTDDTMDWLNAHTDERLESISLPEHSERAVALNTGLERARGDFILFIDDDDRMAPGALEILSGALESRPGAVGAIGGMRWFNVDGQFRKSPAFGDLVVGEVWSQILAGGNVERGQLLIRREVAIATGGWVPEIIISDDTYMALRVARLGPCVIVPDVVMEKRVHAENKQAEDYADLDRRTRQVFLESLGPDQRELGEHALSFFNQWMTAHTLYHRDHRYRSAFRIYRSLLKSAPELARGPLIWPRLKLALIKSGAGSLPGSGVAMTIARRVYSRARRVVGRYPAMGNFPNVHRDDRNYS
ncbi:MAG TPA: glycosyltransferase [Actinomycetota bacterium]|nr:glycosyltransferase [Actinomycetota bacterium]